MYWFIPEVSVQLVPGFALGAWWIESGLYFAIGPVIIGFDYSDGDD